jgi:hypothetical protein
MKRITFTESNRSDDLLHIEAPGCTINIRIGLTGPDNRPVTSVLISPDDNDRSPDDHGYHWRLASDGCRVIRDPYPGMRKVIPSPSAYECLFCGADIEQDDYGQWGDIGTPGLPDGVPSGMWAQATVRCAAAAPLTADRTQKSHVPGGERLMRAARSWVADCEWADLAGGDIADLSDIQVYAGVNRYYEGGWAAFVTAEDA